MPAGIQIFDASGNLTLDVSDRISKNLGYAIIPASTGAKQTGTVSDVNFSLGQLWWVTTLAPGINYTDDVSVSLSGNVLTWTANESCPACTLYYGIF